MSSSRTRTKTTTSKLIRIHRTVWSGVFLSGQIKKQCLIDSTANQMRYGHDLMRTPFKCGTVFICERDNEAFFCLRPFTARRPHMIFNHIPHDIIDCKVFFRIGQGDLRMNIRMPAGNRCIRRSVIQIEVVQHSASGNGNIIEMSLAGNEIRVPGYIQAVLVAGCIHVMGKVSEFTIFAVLYNITDDPNEIQRKFIISFKKRMS